MMTETSLLDRVNTPEDFRDFSTEDLVQLANEVRKDMIEKVSKTGGHLGAGLGVVELTVALHAVFHTPVDRLIWDVGHQCYPHKILTGRRALMESLRQGGGISGFTKSSESIYDPFGAGHSSTSISSGLGFVMARETGQNPDLPIGDVISVIGDGALSAGMAFEALNNAGSLGKRFFVILNDNDMSIAPPVGAMSKYLNSLYRGHYQGVRSLAVGALSLMPSPIQDGAKKTHDLIKHAVQGRATLFEELGFRYFGPIDGHDMKELVETLQFVKKHAEGPTLIHVVTQKGKGYHPAENASDRYHGVGCFDVATGEQVKTLSNAPSFTKIFANKLTELADHDPRIVAITAAMPEGTGLDLFDKAHPGRLFDVAIAEQHAVTFAAGLAAGGARPFCAIYSSFLQRGYDQVVHDVAIQNLPVRFAIDRAGLVGADGPTHAGAFDISYLGALPNMTVVAPSDLDELEKTVAFAAEFDQGPIAFRYPRGAGRIANSDNSPERSFSLGCGRLIQQGKRIAVLSLGTVLDEVLCASAILAPTITPTIFDARFAKPLDRTAIIELAKTHEAILTIEEGSIGGFGSFVAMLLAEENLLSNRAFRMMVLPDRYIEQDTQEKMRKDAGLDEENIAKNIRDLLAI